MHEDKTGAGSTRLFICGNLTTIKQTVAKFVAQNGWCVTVTPTDYIYTGGEEEGVIIEAINYARFPSTQAFRRERMKDLGMMIAKAANQRSFSIMDEGGSSYHALFQHDPRA